MAYDEGLAEIIRADLAGVPGISERKMFGGMAFMLNGNMLCGVHSGGGMFRVGKAHEAAALAIEGAGPMQFTGRRMGGMIDVTDEALCDDIRRAEWLGMSMEFACGLPAK